MQQEKDRRRMELCEKQGVSLIIIPYTLPKEEYENFIQRKLIDV
jgi:hypothetical protein